jgi:hypothetical protein
MRTLDLAAKVLHADRHQLAAVAALQLDGFHQMSSSNDAPLAA